MAHIENPDNCYKALQIIIGNKMELSEFQNFIKHVNGF